MHKMDDLEIIEFSNNYFKEYSDSIWKVTYFEYNGIIEYLINEHYLFLIKR